MKDSVFSGTPVQGNEVSRNPGHENEEFRNSAQEDRGDVFPGHFRKANPITEGAIRQQILLYFFPLLLSSFFQQLYNTADAVIVGQAAGKEALSAVAGSAGSVLGIFMMFYMGYASGAAVLAAQYFGARKKAALRAAVRISFITSAVLGLTGMLVCFGFAAPILTVMGTPADVYGHALQYLRIVSLGMVPNALYNMGAAALRAIGDVRRPLAILIITCLCNIGMDLLLVVFLGMGAPGAALATILCQLLSALLVLRCLRRAVFRQGALRSGSPNAPAPQAAPAQG
ncbi:MAG: MATE family efflux transporter, partial [Eubacteriales bacterium]|nr:MATE family efflux transporter [Eubacteriales bacterium]